MSDGDSATMALRRAEGIDVLAQEGYLGRQQSKLH